MTGHEVFREERLMFDEQASAANVNCSIPPRHPLVSHGFNADEFSRRMSGLYGMVFERQAREIARHLVGETILDVGAGSGFLSFWLRQAGFKPTAIDVAPDSFAFAAREYDVHIQSRDVYYTRFDDKAFDCTVMKEVAFHLDFDRCLEEIARITKERLVVFQGTTNPVLSLGRLMLRHREHNRRSLRVYRRLLIERGWQILSLTYHDPIAFYFSGGVVGPVLWPRWRPLCRAMMSLDDTVNRLIVACRLGAVACCRFLLVAEPPRPGT
jgi:SAM-dependent methyltransferase